MLPSSIELVKHILDEVSFILNAVKGKDKESVINDPVLSRAIVRSLEIVGEASTKLNLEFKRFIHTLNGGKWQIPVIA